MLNVYYGDMPEAIYNPAVYFKNTYEDEWIMDDFSRQMILDVDKSVVISPRIIDSPVLGGITPRELSGGVKTLILIHRVPDKIFNASTCGDNCAKWILKMGEEKDITINLRHLMDFGENRFTLRILNTNQIVHSMEELVPIAGMIVRQESNAFVTSTEFAKCVQQSDNYFVIVTREGLETLPYSVEEIYGIRESGKYATIKQTYNELYRIYGTKTLLGIQWFSCQDKNLRFL